MRYVESELEVLDTKTELIWQREFVENLTYNEALEHAECVSQETGLTWRVPTIEELLSLVEYGHLKPASSFPDMPKLAFWSSSPYVDSTLSAWYVGFNDGVVNGGSRDYSIAVRLVRGG